MSENFTRDMVEAGWLKLMLAVKVPTRLEGWRNVYDDESTREWFLEFLRDIQAERPYKEHFDIVFKEGDGWWIIPVGAVADHHSSLVTHHSSVSESDVTFSASDEFSGPAVVAPLGELLEVSGEYGPRKMAEAEGAAYGREILGTGATAAEVRRNCVVPCPYPIGTPARVWWIKGLLLELKEAEQEAALAAEPEEVNH